MSRKHHRAAPSGNPSKSQSDLRSSSTSPPTAASSETLNLSPFADIREVEGKLGKSESRLAEAQRVAHIGSWEFDLRTNVLTWSDELFRLFGLEPRDNGISCDEAMACLLPEDEVRVRELMDHRMRDQRPLICDYRVRHPDGKVRILHCVAGFIRGDDGQPAKLAGTTQDITERKQSEAEQAELHRQAIASREQLRNLSRLLLQAQEDERRRLAGELHDEIGQILTAVNLSLELTKASADEGGRLRLEESMAVVDRAIEQVRTMSLNLRPAMLDVMGLDSALRWFVDRQAIGSGITIELESAIGARRFAPDLETACYRIVQEALTNAARHAHARSVRVRLVLEGAELTLSVEDDGAGFDAADARLRAKAGGSLGLLGMEERARLLAGDFVIDSAVGRGTAVRVRLPLTSNALPEASRSEEPKVRS